VGKEQQRSGSTADGNHWQSNGRSEVAENTYSVTAKSVFCDTAVVSGKGDCVALEEQAGNDLRVHRMDPVDDAVFYVVRQVLETEADVICLLLPSCVVYRCPDRNVAECHDIEGYVDL
jgi:hypothetical protein